MIRFVIYFIFFIFFNVSLKSEVITGIEYYDPNNFEKFKKNCFSDVKETKEKIANGLLKTDYEDTWIINFISLICKVQNGRIDQIYDDLIYFVESESNQIISKDNYPELYDLYVLVLKPFIKSEFPNLITDDVASDKNNFNIRFEEEIKRLELLVKVDKSFLPEFHSSLGFYILRLIDLGEDEKSKKYFKKFIKYDLDEPNYRDYLNLFGPILLHLFEKEEDLIDYINEVELYFSKYQYEETLHLNQLLAKRKLVRYYSDNKMDEKLFLFGKKQKINADYSIIPKSNLMLLDAYTDLISYYSMRIGGYSYNTFYYQNVFEQLNLIRLYLSILFEDILESDNLSLTFDQKSKFISENEYKLEYALHMLIYESTFYNENDKKFSSDLYWSGFDFKFKISQTLSQNEYKGTIEKILIKHKVKNKNNKKLFDKKFELENIINNQLTFIEASDAIDDKELSELNKNKKELEKINTSLKFQNLEELSILNKTNNIYDVSAFVNEDEAVMFFHETSTHYFLYILSRQVVQNIMFRKDDESENFKSIKNIIDYSRNINNYYNTAFPFEDSYKVYNLFFEFPFAGKEYNFKKFTIVGDGVFSTFPFWLLLTEQQNDFDLSKVNSYPWFSKKFSYSIVNSITDFHVKRKKNKIRLGIQTKPDELQITKIFDGLAKLNKLKVGDTIISINNKKVNDNNELINVLNSLNKNKNFNLEFKRNNKIINKIINLSSKNILQTLNDDIRISIKNSKEYDFVGIGNPILSNSNKDNQNEIIRGLFEEYETRGYVNTEQLQYFPELPETEEELKNIQSNFDIKKTKLYLRNDANEETIKKANLSNAKFIVFASHALVSGEIDDLKEPGIVLTPTDNKNENEGLLLASEISNLNLINTDLVVLSACNTSSSSEANSIPLSGLAKSFFLAGAKSLIVSGWSVESNSAAYLSSGIFKKAMNEDINFSTALQNTINEMIDQNLHPLMWAPFILVGDI